MLKKNLFLGAAVLACTSLCVSPVFAAEEAAEPVETVEAVAVEEVAEEAAYVDTFWKDTVYGSYYGIALIDGDRDGSVANSDICLYPDGTFSMENTLFGTYTVEGDEIAIDLDIEDLNLELKDASITLTGKIAPIDAAVIAESSMAQYCMTDADDLGIYVTAVLTYTDDSNPLSVKTVTKEATTLIVKNNAQDNLMEGILFANEWKIGDNTLIIGDDYLDLNNGAQVGEAMVWWEVNKYHAYVSFDWADGARVKYMFTDITPDSVTIENVADPAEVIVLEKGEAIELVEEVAETETVEE